MGTGRDRGREHLMAAGDPGWDAVYRGQQGAV